jgi:hypothetical protein
MVMNSANTTPKSVERSLQGSSFTTLNIDYASHGKPIAALADDIHPTIADFAERDAPA